MLVSIGTRKNGEKKLNDKKELHQGAAITKVHLLNFHAARIKL